MSLTLKHFDTRLNQWLHTDSNTDNHESVLTEQLDNTLLEFFLPNKQFSFGQMDEYSTATNLENHPDNHRLLFSSKSRLLYGEPESLEVINKLCPDRKDRGAYGSIFLGACKNAVHEKLNILVVDDATGENGGVIDNEDARRLVGDCYGQISPQLYDKLTGRQEKQDYHVIQHRFGWREGDGNDNKYRFGKGTLRPYDLLGLDYTHSSNKPQIDLILPLSSFKGTDKDNPLGAIKPQIKPGLYNQTIWLGEKSQSQQGQTAISQLLASFPQGIKDFVEELELQAQKLAQIQSDPRKVAQLYCETYEKRKAIAQAKNTSLGQPTSLSTSVEDATDSSLEINDFSNEDSIEATGQDDLFMYKLLKADLQGHCQLLETEKVKQELSRFVQSQWRDIAIGRTLTFDRAMIIPSKELKNGEIYVPWFDEGEKVLNFRSPFLNSNGLCVSTNKYVSDCVGPDGKDLKGIIIVNDEDHKRIQARIEALLALCKQVTEIDPPSTESERQGRDFDGDCIGVAKAYDYPNLTAEAEQRNLPQNAYAPTAKLAKQSFYNQDGTQPDFEEIAIFMSDGISVGVINNHVTALEALESEIEILRTHGTLEQQSEYLDTVATHYQKLFAQEKNETHPKPIQQEYKQKMNEFVSLASVKNKTPELIEQALSINRSIYRSMIEFGCFQNQIAVDMFKSARPPDMDLIKENKRYLYRDVNYIKDKKLAIIYLNQGITPNGYSPVELIISQTNQHFHSEHLESRPSFQFQDLFKDVEFTPQQKFAAILAKNQFDQKFNEATRQDLRRRTEIGPSALIQTANGMQIEITNLTRYAHPKIWKAQTLNLKLEKIPDYQRSAARPHCLLAVAQIDGEMENGQPKYRRLGTVDQQSTIDNQLKAGMATNGAAVVNIIPELQESGVKLLFGQANAIAKNFSAKFPQCQRLSAAAAVWSVTTFNPNKASGALNNSQQTNYSQNKLSNFIFAAFPNEIISRLNQLQFNTLKLTGINQADPIFQSKVWTQAKYQIEISAIKNLEVGQEQQHTRSVLILDANGEYKKVGILDQKTGRLPIGTKAEASIIPGDAYTATAILAEPGKPSVEFTIREIGKFAHAGQVFDGKQVSVAIANTPVPTDTVTLTLDGKVLGELDSDSINELKKVNYLENNKTLNLKLKSIGSTVDPGGFVIGESTKGNLLRINKVSYYGFKGQNFNDATYRNVTLELPPHKHKTAVFLDNKLLGVLHFNKDKEALKQLGLLKPTGSSFVQCNLQSNFSHSYLTVDPNTVEYPQTWVKQSVALKDAAGQIVGTPQQAMIDKSSSFLHKLKERATVLFSSHEDKMLGLTGLAVDNNKLPVVQQWLQSKNIEFNLVPKQEVSNESHKGLAVLYLNTNTITPQDLQSLKAKFGKPLAADGFNSLYNQYLKSLPNRPQKHIGEGSAKTNNPTSTKFSSLKATTTSSNAISTHSIDPIASNASATTTLSSPSPSKISNTTLDTLRQWYTAAKELNKPQVYLDSITFIANEFKHKQVLPENANAAMQQDLYIHHERSQTIAELNNLDDRDFLLLHQSVNHSLKTAPTRPPSQVEVQSTQAEITQLNTQRDILFEEYSRLNNIINSASNGFLRNFNPEYKQAISAAQKILSQINTVLNQHEHKESKIVEWGKQVEAYRAWKTDAKTVQVQKIAQVLQLPQMQERLMNIQHALGQQEQQKQENLRYNQQQQKQEKLRYNQHQQ